MAVQILTLLNSVLLSCGHFFSTLLQKSGMVGIFYSMLFIAMLFKFVISPFVGYASFVGASDTVREYRESHRPKGKYERNQKGRYSK